MILDSITNWLEKRGKARMIRRQDFKTKNWIEYLKRHYLIRTKYLGMFIHQFWSSDEDGVHCHPWSNMTIVLRGGFYEELADGQVLWRPPGFWCFRKAEQFHRIILKPGTEGKVWTLFIRFKRYRRWGFLTEKKWVDAEYMFKEQMSSEVN
jgi:hypothetical protein